MRSSDLVQPHFPLLKGREIEVRRGDTLAFSTRCGLFGEKEKSYSFYTLCALHMCLCNEY